MKLTDREIAILNRYGGNNKDFERINELSRENGWTHDILSHWISYVLENTPFMYDKLEIWANNIAEALKESEYMN